jgi:cellulose biosynthesis protein BcsQ
MKVLTVHNTMQNQAKSTLVWLLAVAFGEAGKRCIVVDTDDQQTLYNYTTINPYIPKPFQAMTLAHYLEARKNLRADIILFDTERDVTALKPDLALAAFEVSDFILVPTITDEKALVNMARVCQTLDTTFKLETAFSKSNGAVKKADIKKSLLKPDPNPRKHFATIFTRVDPNRLGSELAEIRRNARIYGCNPLSTHLSENSSVRETFNKGSLPKIEQASQLMAEAEAIMKEVSRYLGEPAS